MERFKPKNKKQIREFLIRGEILYTKIDCIYPGMDRYEKKGGHVSLFGKGRNWSDQEETIISLDDAVTRIWSLRKFAYWDEYANLD